jgi:hypothetical protein
MVQHTQGSTQRPNVQKSKAQAITRETPNDAKNSTHFSPLASRHQKGGSKVEWQMKAIRQMDEEETRHPWLLHPRHHLHLLLRLH